MIKNSCCTNINSIQQLASPVLCEKDWLPGGVSFPMAILYSSSYSHGIGI